MREKIRGRRIGPDHTTQKKDVALGAASANSKNRKDIKSNQLASFDGLPMPCICCISSSFNDHIGIFSDFTCGSSADLQKAFR